jgi:hypothetical protein
MRLCTKPDVRTDVVKQCRTGSKAERSDRVRIVCHKQQNDVHGR